LFAQRQFFIFKLSFAMTKNALLSGPWTVIYRHSSAAPSAQHREVTYNVPLTISTLEAQGFIIIDIIEGG
jgi:hypothetical protein